MQAKNKIVVKCNHIKGDFLLGTIGGGGGGGGGGGAFLSLDNFGPFRPRQTSAWPELKNFLKSFTSKNLIIPSLRLFLQYPKPETAPSVQRGLFLDFKYKSIACL